MQRLVRDLEGEFYVDEREVARAVRDRTSVNLVHLGTGVKVDAFVKSAEDTVLRKLLWFRLGGEASDRAGREPRCPLPHPLGRTARNSRLAGPLDGGRLSAEDLAHAARAERGDALVGAEAGSWGQSQEGSPYLMIRVRDSNG